MDNRKYVSSWFTDADYVLESESAFIRSTQTRALCANIMVSCTWPCIETCSLLSTYHGSSTYTAGGKESIQTAGSGDKKSRCTFSASRACWLLPPPTCRQDVVTNLQLGAGGVQDRKQFALKIAKDLFQVRTQWHSCLGTTSVLVCRPTDGNFLRRIVHAMAV